MTIRIGVKNLDNRADAIVAVKRQDAKGQPISGAEDKKLKGGEETEEYVHAGQRLVVEEVKNG